VLDGGEGTVEITHVFIDVSSERRREGGRGGRERGRGERGREGGREREGEMGGERGGKEGEGEGEGVTLQAAAHSGHIIVSTQQPHHQGMVDQQQ
jgi:hypothetical protein